MLAIRMQRTGRSGHAMFRLVVQDSRRTPTSGKIVTLLGHYDPHTKALVVDKDKATFYLEHGAQPSPRTAKLLKSEGLKLPKWVVISNDAKGQIRHPDKFSKDQPKEVPQPVADVEAVESTEAAIEETKAEVAESSEAATKQSEAAPKEPAVALDSDVVAPEKVAEDSDKA